MKRRTRPYAFRRKDITDYLIRMRKAERAESTISSYGETLSQFAEFLGEEALIYPDTPVLWKEDLVKRGYAPRTINCRMVAVNGFLDYVGCHDWILSDWMELGEDDAPELTREEYQALLRKARRQEEIQLYLIIKTLACTELTPGDLDQLTREAVNEGAVRIQKRGTDRELRIPPRLQEDLLTFAIQNGIRSGAVFLNRSRKPYDRITISRMVTALGAETGLEPGKATPRNLRRMYLSTLGGFRKKADRWVEDSYRRLLEEEESKIGWKI